MTLRNDTQHGMAQYNHNLYKYTEHEQKCVIQNIMLNVN